MTLFHDEGEEIECLRDEVELLEKELRMVKLDKVKMLNAERHDFYRLACLAYDRGVYEYEIRAIAERRDET